MNKNIFDLKILTCIDIIRREFFEIFSKKKDLIFLKKSKN